MRKWINYKCFVTNKGVCGICDRRYNCSFFHRGILPCQHLVGKKLEVDEILDKRSDNPLSNRAVWNALNKQTFRVEDGYLVFEYEGKKYRVGGIEEIG